LRALLAAKKWRETLVVTRTIVSQSLEIKEAWQERLKAPVFQKINMGEYFVSLERKFSHEYRGSAVDVDIFANNVNSEAQAEHMEELLHKLRRTPHTVHTLESTNHAAVRAMLDHGELSNLVKMLDDRLNYGLFLDEYTAILTLDKLLDSGELKAAARCASQLMLQEEDFPLPSALGNLACYKYLRSGREDAWFYPEEIQVDEDPDEIVRVRVPMVPNNYKDNHFDLKDPDRILGKCFIHFNRNAEDRVGRSLLLLGKYMFGDIDDSVTMLGTEEEVATEVLAVLKGSDNPEVVSAAEAATPIEIDLVQALEARCKEISSSDSAALAERQKNIYCQWNQARDQELQRQYEEMQRSARVEAISQTKVDLAKEEEQLFFFENLDRYEMEAEEKVRAWRKTLPRYDWDMAHNIRKRKALKKTSADGERKIARWENREKKFGPPK